jgi:hypothetical protein
MTKNKALILLVLLALARAGCSSDEEEDDAAAARLSVVAGEPVELVPPEEVADGASCVWVVSQAALAEDKDRELSAECRYTIPGDFAAERTGRWAVQLIAENPDGETITHTVGIQVTPDTVGNLVLGYAVIFGIGVAFIGSMVWRMNALRKQATLLANLAADDE